MVKNTGTSFTRRRGIKFRITAAFILVAGLAVGSAVIAWLSVSTAQDQVRQITRTTLPTVTKAQILAKETALFAALADSLSRVLTEEERNVMVQSLEEKLDALTMLISRMEETGFDRKNAGRLRGQVDILGENLLHQSVLASQFIEVSRHLKQQMDSLHQLHDDFIKTAGQRIDTGYNTFLAHGNAIGREVLETLENLKRNDGGSEDDLEKEIRVGFATLINSEAAEMRANLEMVAAAYLAVGILNEAADTDRIERIEQLQEQFSKLLASVFRIRLTLSASTPKNRRVLTTAMPLIAFGQGPDNIFDLRRLELKRRQQVANVAGENTLLAEQLTVSVNQMVDASSEKALKAAEQLRKSLSRATFIQFFTAMLSVLVALVIGWIYMGRQVIGRILSLKEAMEGQSLGRDVPIPTGGGDELGEMSQALHRFVQQRRSAEAELLAAKEAAEMALVEVRQLSGLLPICSNCKKIRDDSGYWNQLEAYISTHSEAEFSHSICPDCVRTLYPELKLEP